MCVFGQVEEILGFQIYMTVSSTDMKKAWQGIVTSMDHVVVMEVVDGFEDLLDRLRGVFLCKLAVFADPVKKLSPCRQLGDDVVLILYSSRRQFHCILIPSAFPNTFDSNQS